MQEPTYVESSPAEHRVSKYPKSKKNIVIIGIISLAVIAVGVLWWAQSRVMSVHIPKTVTEQALFTIFVPTALPKGYELVEDSFSLNEGVLIFSVKGPGDRAIAFTQQAVPAGFDFTSFYSKQMTDVKKIEDAPYQTALGRASIAGAEGTAHDKMLSIRADETWIIATGDASDEDMTYIAKHMRKY